MPTSTRFHLPCRPAYQREATPHRRVVRHSFQCRPPDKAVPRAQKQVRHFQCGQDFCDFAVAYNTVHMEWILGKHHLSDDQAYQVCYSMLRSPSSQRVNFNFNFFLTFRLQPVCTCTRLDSTMVSSKGQQDLPSGHQVLWWISRYYFMDSEVIIFQLLFVWRRLAMVYLKSCVAEVIKSSWSWVSLR